MKNILIISILAALMLTSCSDYLDVNSDPNNPTEVTPDLILPVGQLYTAEYIQANRRASHLGNMFMYNWSESYGFSWYNDEFQYLVTSTFYQSLFNDAYLRSLKQYTDLQFLDPMYDNYKAIGMIMNSYHFQLLVDFYGDVPYSEALQRGGNSTPVYDDAASIYADLLVKLDEAIAVINAASDEVTTVSVGDDDTMFGGDMLKWKQFANSIKLRVLVRQSDVNPSIVQAEINKIAAEGSGYITEDVMVQPGFLQEEFKQNPFWNGLGADFGGTTTMNHNATCATDFILDYLRDNGDKRIDTLFAKGKNGHLGVPQGVTVGPDYGQTFVSLIGDGLLKGYDMGAVIFSLSESYFNQAEAALKGYGGDPEALYESGVKASFSYLGFVPSVAENHLDKNLPNVNYEASPDKLEAIITQKWLAMMGITAEQSWFDYSRTGFPKNLPISNQASTPDRPVRLHYPSSEITGNTINVPEQKNAFTDKIFWAK
ncbi:SusD/RagB family nutrient-binding outer membrane lipoprotein [Carboxylicivirga marina]|uniref:SusD/RagB family nutrient-binding outer membrane lipoprotein n=1 Tax=Carboxylicivirga marina TaxID=2800988 RepID=UPI0025996AF3|nr:SusD/RagB family nutrient-binding outer membrane lipoprotein [uncultured Carboxylicivirga sp.]